MSPLPIVTGGRVEPLSGAALGAVYTPPFLASWVTKRLLRSLPSGAREIVDLACGEGALLSAVAEQSGGALELTGADIDANALRRAAKALPQVHLKRMDAIDASLRGLDRLRRRLESNRIDGLILNPPWGIDVGVARSDLHAAGFELAHGQYDSADLFLELAVKLLDEGGAAAFILPDSLFFPDRAPVRRFLLETCTIDLVARLGEGFFPGVFRGAAVVVLRRGSPAKRHTIECLRLSPEQRKLALSHSTTLDQIAAETAHSVPQSRFARSPNAAFAIDIRQVDLRHVRLVYRQPSGWTETLTSGRGVELSKHGEIVLCGACGQGRPRPRKSNSVRCECGAEIDPAHARAQKIVRRASDASYRDWKPLIAGEDVKRYSCSPGRAIQTGVNGINYKRPIDFSGPRLLIRKTGIALKAALFTGRALTTQTVFHFQSTKRTPSFLLPYALGVLSSRIMLAVHLKHTGEVEWRSHPYVTQRLLAELPIPQPLPDSQQWRQAQAIADLVSRCPSDGPREKQDFSIERLVAGLYGFTAEDFEWVNRVLHETQGLEGVAALRIPSDLRLAPVLVN